MQKIIINNNRAVAILSNGNIFERELTDEEIDRISGAESEDEIFRIMCPEYQKILDENNKTKDVVEKVANSNILTFENNAIYWPSVSGLSVPKDLAESILKAEIESNKLLLTTYRNFWTLMSLNPNEECRNNLYWFLQLHGLKLAKCGFFVAYRNVDTTDTPGVYTDYHSRTTKITMGEMVTLPRKECDCNSDVECSQGLHLASKNWLKRNYFGDTGLACLANPADIVAVPHRSAYGKLRTCAYLPIKFIEYGDDDCVIPINVEDGFDCSYVTKVIYEGIMGTEKDSPYKIEIKPTPEIKVESIQNRLLEIAKECIVNREVF